ncbi:MAG: hypothetical protein DRJ38_03305 [Thermoprotei archaeon]|nr:MAG: hypothetical protein DRJ38_03305 [Thermoprotei archaeon]
MSKEEIYPPPRSGLTKRSFLVLMFSLLAFTPAVIWHYLATGSTFRIGWVTFFLFAEILAFFGMPPTSAEGVVLVTISGQLKMLFLIFTTFIYREYYLHSPVAKMFNTVPHIPDWWVAKSPEVWMTRTFLHPDWLIPLSIGIGFNLLTLLSDIMMGLLTRELYIEVEKLPFPMQHVTADGIIALTERPKERMRILTLGINLGVIYSAILYGIPIITELFGFEALSVAPIPWWDLSENIHNFLPGAAMGIATSLLVFMTGMVISFNVVVGIFASSLAIHVIGNHLLVKYGWTQFSKEWYHGMKIRTSLSRSWMYAWMGPFIGASLAASIMPIIHHRRYLSTAIKSLTKVRKDARERVLSLSWILAIWTLSVVASILVVYMLVPGYPIWMMLIISYGWSFIWTLLTARAVGETGMSLEAPALLPIAKSLYVSMTGYKGLDIWFIDPVISTGGSQWCANFKVCQLAGCSMRSYIKTYVLGYPLAVIFAFIFTQIFWSIAPMPSSAFPSTNIYWPLQAVTQSMWMTGKVFTGFPIEHILGAFVLVAALYWIAQITHLPLPITTIPVGMATPVPIAISTLIGGIIGKIMAKKYGEQWRKARTTLTAGATLGTAVTITFLLSIVLIAKSLRLLPY